MAGRAEGRARREVSIDSDGTRDPVVKEALCLTVPMPASRPWCRTTCCKMSLLGQSEKGTKDLSIT